MTTELDVLLWALRGKPKQPTLELWPRDTAPACIGTVHHQWYGVSMSFAYEYKSTLLARRYHCGLEPANYPLPALRYEVAIECDEVLILVPTTCVLACGATVYDAVEWWNAQVYAQGIVAPRYPLPAPMMHETDFETVYLLQERNRLLVLVAKYKTKH